MSEETKLEIKPFTHNEFNEDTGAKISEDYTTYKVCECTYVEGELMATYILADFTHINDAEWYVENRNTRSPDVAEAIGEIDKQIEACTTFMAKGNNAFTQLGALNQLTKIKKLLEVKGG